LRPPLRSIANLDGARTAGGEFELLLGALAGHVDRGVDRIHIVLGRDAARWAVELF